MYAQLEDAWFSSDKVVKITAFMGKKKKVENGYSSKTSFKSTVKIVTEKNLL